MFYCPRSIFARNECLRCSRLFVKRELEVSAEYLENLNILSYLHSDEKEIQEFEFTVFWNNDYQRSVINSDVKRCLNTFIIQYSKQFLLLFLEIQIRIFMIFFILYREIFQMKKKREFYF